MTFMSSTSYQKFEGKSLEVILKKKKSVCLLIEDILSMFLKQESEIMNKSSMIHKALHFFNAFTNELNELNLKIGFEIPVHEIHEVVST